MFYFRLSNAVGSLENIDTLWQFFTANCGLINVFIAKAIACVWSCGGVGVGTEEGCREIGLRWDNRELRQWKIWGINEEYENVISTIWQKMLL